MALSLTQGFRPPTLSLFHREFYPPITLPRKQQLPTSPRHKMNPKISTFFKLARPQILSVSAKLEKKIEAVSDELNRIASQNLDHAPARRRVRSAFSEVQRQLDHPLFKMAPTGIRTKEWYEWNSLGSEIFCKSWLPEPGVRIKGALCFCHGYGDTCTFFFEGIAKRIASSGFGVYALDHPGFGLSEGLHGYVPSFNGLVDNVIEHYRKIKERPEVKGLPFFMLGQSMGGAVSLKVLLREPYAWDGIILVAPMCKISDDVLPPPAALKVLNLLSRVMPKAKLIPQKDLAELAFRDLKKRETALYNVICYNDNVRVRTAVELIQATKDIEARVDEVSSPLLIIHGAADKVTDPQVSKFLYEKASSKDKTLKLYEDCYHSILEGEPGDMGFTVLDDIVAWLDYRCSSKN
ncbi:hypothetical protein K2173_000239 [Erythroxylum novogranatense]|uniref:Serine aminopeptidase S33 domain-containing protein n=1 Tax=Erythroxylum novogranatense TaxID=1862640 RepID=A0AAV8SW18_9ROSI|nr:hypothetical protein K2173_000239 [Erythroxylum novogranatense]